MDSLSIPISPDDGDSDLLFLQRHKDIKKRKIGKIILHLVLELREDHHLKRGAGMQLGLSEASKNVGIIVT
ncbi:hypothetical protein RJ641_016495 [Dillenia turbinata]|uniref:Uncharacterized protein n=1 Tax=Dillenia turbinata TaxID=194707 RepID=A0AAN8UYI2_9MAGN